MQILTHLAFFIQNDEVFYKIFKNFHLFCMPKNAEKKLLTLKCSKLNIFENTKPFRYLIKMVIKDHLLIKKNLNDQIVSKSDFFPYLISDIGHHSKKYANNNKPQENPVSKSQKIVLIKLRRDLNLLNEMPFCFTDKAYFYSNGAFFYCRTYLKSMKPLKFYEKICLLPVGYFYVK